MNAKPTPEPLTLTEIDRLETQAGKPNCGARHWTDADVLRLIATIRALQPPQSITVWWGSFRLTISCSLAQKLGLRDGQRITPERAARLTAQPKDNQQGDFHE
jgi:hypothetical protein